MPRSYPRWRHWHVEGRDFGYKKAEAIKIAADDSKYYDFKVKVERCDVDHSI